MMRYCFILFIFSLSFNQLNAQQITFSDYNKADGRDIYFEILGKGDSNYIIYKKIHSKHNITIYDKEMHIIETVHLNQIPERTFNVDFINYPGFFYLIYQYEKNNIVHCKCIKMNNAGKILTPPTELDTTRIGFFADNKIYNTTYSEDRQKILIYKMQFKNETLAISAKVFNANLQILDSTRQLMEDDDRKDSYTDMQIDNGGAILFVKQIKSGRRDYIKELNILTRSPNASSFETHSISLDDKYVDEASIKIDNLNHHYILNCFYYTRKAGKIEGLFTAVINKDSINDIKKAFNAFDDSLRAKIILTGGEKRTAFDNFFARNIILKKDGGFIFSAEDYYVQYQNNNSWDRRNYLSNAPLGSTIASSDYYAYNAPYYDYYRPYGSYANDRGAVYFYNNILILSFTPDLKLQWKSILYKKQSDTDTDNFLSYSNINSGGEIHFLFLEDDRKRQIISDHSLLPDGEIKRYPTLKSGEKGYFFMPRLAKQVGNRQIIMPFIFRNNVAFAKIDF